MTCNIVSLRLYIAKMERFVSLDSNVCPKSLPSGSAEKNPPAMQRYERCGLNPWPWRRQWQPIPVFLPGEFRGPSVGSQRVGHEWAHMLCFSVLHLWLLSFQWIDSIACTDFLPCKMAFLLKNLRASWFPKCRTWGPDDTHTHSTQRGTLSHQAWVRGRSCSVPFSFLPAEAAEVTKAGVPATQFRGLENTTLISPPSCSVVSPLPWPSDDTFFWVLFYQAIWNWWSSNSFILNK